MDSRARVLSLAMRTLLAGGLALLMLHVLASTQYYATAAALGGLMLLMLRDVARLQDAPPVLDSGTNPQRRLHLQQLDRATALLDAVTVALIALEPDGRISFANRAARLLAGRSVSRLANIAALGESAANEIAALPVGARRIVTPADGRPMLVWNVGISIPGQPAQKLVSLQAVTGELDAVQLRAWQDMARVLSHEIMNSLTPIASLSESAARLMEGREESEPKVVRAVHAISRRSLHLIDFVERYRQVTELPEPRVQPITTSELVADIEAVLQQELAEQGVAHECILRPPDLTFEGDPELLSQALLNLLRNAAEALRPVESPFISFSCEGIGEDVVFSVADNGPGISADRREEVFVPFFTTKAGGSGIGLTLVRQIALAHGGRIEALPRPGGGVLMRMALPARV